MNDIAVTKTTELPRYASVEELIGRESTGRARLCHPSRKIPASRRSAFWTRFPATRCYAVKANPHPHVLDQVWAAGIRHFDTASLAEIELVRRRYPDAHCHFMAPVRAPGAAKTAFEKYGVTDFVVDCDFELDKLVSETDPKKIRVFVRIATPLGGAVLELSSKFGTTPDDAARLLKRVTKAGAAPCITFHVGSQCLSPFSYAQAIEMARRTAGLAGMEIAALDVGGGFPGPYHGNDVPPYHWYFDTIREALGTMRAGPAGDLRAGPRAGGRGAFAGDAGDPAQGRLALPERRRLWQLRRADAAGLGGGLSHPRLPRRRKGKAKPMIGTTKAFRAYGPTCDTLDVLPGPLPLPENIAAGDFIVFDAIGAYSVAVRTDFNGFFPDRWAIAGN